MSVNNGPSNITQVLDCMVHQVDGNRVPSFLPTLFPVRVRAVGTGVAYNFGRIFSAIAMLSSTALSTLFAGNIAKMGATTSLVYGAGILLV